MPFQFNPPDGYRNTVTFPQKPANEAAFRDQMMQPLDQLAAYVNSPDPLPQYAQNGMSRQGFINGGFDIWQRGGSFSGRNIYTADRWFVADDGGSASYTVSRGAFPPGETYGGINPENYLSLNVISMSTGAITVGQKIENVRSFAGQKVTLSMYARCSNPSANIQVAAFQVFGTTGSPSPGQSVSANISLTNAFQLVTVTLSLPSVTGKTITDNSHIYFQIVRLGNNALPGTYDFAYIQLNAGDKALPFQPRSFSEELVMCQRYFEKSYNYNVTPGTSGATQGIENKVVPGNTISNLQTYGKTGYKVQKRIEPTVTVYPYTNPSNKGRVSSNSGADLGANSGVVLFSGATGFTVQNNSGGPLTTSDSSVIFHWTADAEL